MYLQEKLEKTKTQLNKDNDNINHDMSVENSSDMGDYFLFLNLINYEMLILIDFF